MSTDLPSSSAYHPRGQVMAGAETVFCRHPREAKIMRCHRPASPASTNNGRVILRLRSWSLSQFGGGKHLAHNLPAFLAVGFPEEHLWKEISRWFLVVGGSGPVLWA